MIPVYNEKGNLPPGIYLATWAEIEQRYCYNACRQTIPNPAVFDHLSYFQFDDRTGDKKGIIALDLDSLP